MRLNVPCFHSSGCHDKNHIITFDLPIICGVHDCNREAKTTLRQGLTFYNVCTIHAHGEEVKDINPLHHCSEDESYNPSCEECARSNL